MHSFRRTRLKRKYLKVYPVDLALIKYNLTFSIPQRFYDTIKAKYKSNKILAILE